jgi:hypothetical protein
MAMVDEPAPSQSASPLPDKFHWLLEEYKLLSDHSRHEDAELKKTLAMFLTLNTALLGFAASKLSDSETDVRWMMPIVGLLLWWPWIPSMARIRAFRNYFEHRERAIEETLQRYWHTAETPIAMPNSGNAEFRVLDIRSFEKWKGGRVDWPPKGFGRLLHILFGNWPTSFTYLLLPCGFLVLWLVLLGMRLAWWAPFVAAAFVIASYLLPAFFGSHWDDSTVPPA